MTYGPLKASYEATETTQRDNNFGLGVFMDLLVLGLAAGFSGHVAWGGPLNGMSVGQG
jgi:hypothetical protein